MYLAGFIERMGTGTGDIILLCEEAGLKKAPEFLQEEIFKTILWRKNAEKIESQKVEVGDKIGDKITENQMQLLECIRKDPYISAQKIAEQIGITSRKTEDNIKKLKGLGLLERIGTGHLLLKFFSHEFHELAQIHKE